MTLFSEKMKHILNNNDADDDGRQEESIMDDDDDDVALGRLDQISMPTDKLQNAQSRLLSPQEPLIPEAHSQDHFRNM